MNPSTESKLISTPTKCKICGHVFNSDLLREAAVLGGNPQAKLQQVAAMTKPLMKHLEKSHPDVIQQAQMTGGQFAGYLTLLAFECDEDVSIKLGSDYTRWQVHKLTARQAAIPSDERIRERVKEAMRRANTDDDLDDTEPNEDSTFKHMVALLCDLRDSITEKDRYSPQRPTVETPSVN